MITAEHQLYCLFGWKHKWLTLIPYSFFVEHTIVCMNAGNNKKMGTITARHVATARWDDDGLKPGGAEQSEAFVTCNGNTSLCTRDN